MKSFLLFSVLLTGAASAAVTQNLVVNGDAESGDFTGWTTTNDLEIYDDPGASQRGTTGLLPTSDVGRYSFVGGTGPTISNAFQLVSLTSFLADISTGQQVFEFQVTLQSRAASGVTDTASADFSFLDSAAQEISGESFVDSASGGFTWTEFSFQGIIPAQAESVLITIDSRRSGFNSTDAYIDSVSFALVPEPSSTLLLSLGAVALMRRKRSR